MSLLANALAKAVDTELMPSEIRASLKEALYKEAERLAGRPVEVEQTTDQQFIVLWMHFQASPPPKATSEAAALAGFIEMMLKRKGDNLPKEDTDGTNDSGKTIDN